jgi:2-hydroxycyclohexanecarboxyl-CoA dehydrogenase
MSLQGLGGRVALVTGAAGGIGRRVAETLLALGSHVAVCDIEAPEIVGALGVAMDVTDAAAVAAGVTQVEGALGPVAVVVAAAGIFEPRAFDQLESAEWQRMLDVNLTGTFECVRRVVPAMCEHGWGRVVTLSSMAGIDGGSRACAHYAASKGALIAFTKAVSKEHCHRGITANVVAPRAIRTAMVAGLEEELTPNIPVGRLGEVDDVAAVVAFLCSAHAAYITGEVVVLNGGWW